MKTGFRGTFVISWSQTELDGLKGGPMGDLRVGAMWWWTGEAVRVDGPSGVLPLALADDQVDVRRRAGVTVRRLLGQRDTQDAELDLQRSLFDNTFTVTNGTDTWDVVVVPAGAGRKPLLMFHGQIPPRQTELYVVRHNLTAQVRHQPDADPGGVICFTPGTLIDTPYGPRDIASLRQGDYVQTRDNGPAPIVWMGRRRISGARLQVMPHLAPIRLRRGALGDDVPDAGLLVSPDHRVLIRGAQAQALFGHAEVLVAARDLVNDYSIIVDRAVRQVSYLHMMLPRHEIVFANGVATETFHPASAELATMELDENDAAMGLPSGLMKDPGRYGGYARRVLAPSEAAILKHDHPRRRM